MVVSRFWFWNLLFLKWRTHLPISLWNLGTVQILIRLSSDFSWGLRFPWDMLNALHNWEVPNVLRRTKEMGERNHVGSMMQCMDNIWYHGLNYTQTSVEKQVGLPGLHVILRYFRFKCHGQIQPVGCGPEWISESKIYQAYQSNTRTPQTRSFWSGFTIWDVVSKGDIKNSYDKKFSCIGNWRRCASNNIFSVLFIEFDICILYIYIYIYAPIYVCFF